MGSGLPGWNDVVADLVQELPCSQETDPLTIAQAYQHKYDRAALIHKIREHTDTTGKQPTRVHELLPRLQIPTWITTNFDDLLETTLRAAKCLFHVIHKDTHVPYSRPHEMVLIKLHGDRNDPDSIVFTKNDYSLPLLKKPLLWSLLKVALAQKTLLFIGYGLADPDFEQLQASVLSALGHDHYRRSYAISFAVDPLRRAALEARKVTVIDLGLREREDATSALHDVLSAIVERLRMFSPIPPEYHDKGEAAKCVPGKTKAELRAAGFRLICCVEYHVYCGYFDEREPMSIPHGWQPPPPPEYPEPKYRCMCYRRTDKELMNIWDGWAVGERLE